jgi:glycogen debranching enzyme
MSYPPRQPWLHELSVIVRGNATALSSSSGDIEGAGAAGLYVDDRRAVNHLVVLVGDERPSGVSAAAVGSRAEFLASARNLGTASPDPVVEVRRVRTLEAGGLVERVSLVSRAAEVIRTRLTVRLGCDDADIGSVKAGLPDVEPVAPSRPDPGEGAAEFVTPWHRHRAVFRPLPDATELDGATLVSTFDVVLEPQCEVVVVLTVSTSRRRASLFDADPGGDELAWDDVSVTGDDPRLEPTFCAALEDLTALTLRDPEHLDDVFAGAGTPWSLTLFGRDSIWAARLTLPLGTTLAEGTLRSLARRQGTRQDPATAQDVGKIPHEVRRFAHVDPVSGLALPPVYYGTVDATALWVLLLHDAWTWGMPDAVVDDLLAPLEAAAGWLMGAAAPDPDGLLKYIDHTGSGLSNQGWKDSGDAVRHRDGSIAVAPISLVEAQAYAAHALACAARLVEAFGRDGSAAMLARSAELKALIHDRYWVPDSDAAGARHLGLAIDGNGVLVDGLASNMGHVLGTGCLSAEEADLVAAAVTGPELLDRFGVRTLGVGNGGYNPIGYHTGSIWTHDTAIIALGLAQEGRTTQAVAVARTLLASAEAFDYRWPELYAGTAALGHPAPYPAACRPQAWSAASAVALLTVALGLRPDAATRTLHVRPARPAAYGAMRVEGLRFCGGRVDLDLAADGTVTVLQAPDGVEVRVHG